MLRIILYTGWQSPEWESLIERIEALAPGSRLEICDSLTTLSFRLRGPRKESTLAVLAPNNAEEVSRLAAFQDLFSNIRVILVLPDRKKTTIRHGHRMCPRFVTYQERGLKDVALVLNKMMSNPYWGGKE